MAELDETLENLIARAEEGLNVMTPRSSPRGSRAELAKVTNALSVLKAALVKLRRSVDEHDDLVSESRTALGTINGRMLSGDWEGARDYVENVPFRSIVSDKEEKFRDVAATICRPRSLASLGLFHADPRHLIVDNIRSTFGMAAPKAGIDKRNDLIGRLGHLRFWQRDIDAALYWIAHAAEHSLLTSDLPSEPDEDDFNRALPLAVQNAAKEYWPSLVLALGYSKSFPFEIGVFISTKKTIEPQTGMDFALVVYFRLEDGDTRIYAAIVQGKPEHKKKPLMTNIYRRAKSYGFNHQFRTLADKAETAYYAFYPTNLVTSPISFVPVTKIVSALQNRRPGVAFEDMRYSDCHVSIEAGAVDLPTFFAKLMVNHQGHKSLASAIRDLGSPRPSLAEKAQDMSSALAKRLILIEVGSRMPQPEIDLILSLGFRRSADLGMMQDMSPNSPGGMASKP